MKIAWDGCVLALGLVGGVLYNAEASKSLSSSWPLIIAIGSIVTALSTAILILYWREANPPKGWKVLVSLALSGGVLAIPAYFALT